VKSDDGVPEEVGIGVTIDIAYDEEEGSRRLAVAETTSTLAIRITVIPGFSSE